MAYMIYRGTSLGISLRETLDDLQSEQQLPPTLAEKIMKQFDESINRKLAEKPTNKINFKGQCSIYRHVNNVWTFTLQDVRFKLDDEVLDVDKLKIVACDSKGEK
eukprot:m.106045 g.106045  ORF g.106045 m.106045 type:complete len:105 (+) comp22521_c0_seq3:147-461(+)